MKSRHGHIIERKRQIPNWVVLLFALAGMAAAVTSLAIIAPQIMPLFQPDDLANNNRTWLTREWAQTQRPPEDLTTLIEILSDNRIQLAYVQLGSWHGQTGQYIELPYGQSFLEQFRAQTSTIQLYLWIVIPPDKLVNADARQQVVEVAKQAEEQMGFKGVHLQARSVPNESTEFLDLLREVRAGIGDGIVLSITVPPDRTPFDPSVPASPVANDDLTWSQAYKQRVLLNVDEIVLMSHASSLSSPEEYEIWVAYQVATYADIIQGLGLGMSYIVALPTYAAELGHDPEVENVETALRGVKAGMDQGGGSGGEVDGVGLYPWEQTDLIELDTYWENWVQRKE